MRSAVAFGVDLAWSERNRSGCVALDRHGAVVDERLLVSDVEIVDWIVELADTSAAVAIDAPLLVPNDSGRRPCESELHRIYGSRKAGPHSSNRELLIRNNGRIRGEDLRRALESFGFVDPWAGASRTLIEVYPHPALVEAFSLPERLPYKKGAVDVRRAGLRDLHALISSLSDAEPPLHADTIDIHDDLRGQPMKNVEDLLDARMCAWLAALWMRHGEARMKLFGSSEGGHIAVPTGPAMRSARPDTKPEPLAKAVRTATQSLGREEQRFEIAVGNFMRSCLDLQANEPAFQAWYAASVVAEFGLARVYREIHLKRSSLAAAAPTLITANELKQSGYHFLPDLSVSRQPAIDARHSATRSQGPDAATMLRELAIVSEFKATGSTTKPTSPSAIRTDLFKLGVFAEARQSGVRRGPGAKLATYLVILDNYASDDGPRPHYGPKRMLHVLRGVAERWPSDVPRPTVIVGGQPEGGPQILVYRDFAAT